MLHLALIGFQIDCGHEDRAIFCFGPTIWLQMNRLSLRNYEPIEVQDFRRIGDRFRGI
jgi:hypothetical protein